MENPFNDVANRRLAAELLRFTSSGGTAFLTDVATRSGSTASLARGIILELGLLLENDGVVLSSEQRLHLAIRLAQAGTLEAARLLDWQEFEKFTKDSLAHFGFSSERNTRVRGGGRSWQIDVVGVKGPLILCFDCKHWKPPNYLSKFERPAEHQRKAAAYLVSEKTTRLSQNRAYACLPIILTLYEPPRPVHRNVVLLSVEKLPDFLDKVSPLMPELPFIHSGQDMENSIKDNPL